MTIQTSAYVESPAVAAESRLHCESTRLSTRTSGRKAGILSRYSLTIVPALTPVFAFMLISTKNDPGKSRKVSLQIRKVVRTE